MAATYVPTGDHGLSAEAQALSPERVINEVLVAELALGLAGSALTDDDAERAKSAIARQVNMQIRVAGESGDIISEGKGRQSVTYATVNGVRVMVDKLAMQIAQMLIGPPAKSTASSSEIAW